MGNLVFVIVVSMRWRVGHYGRWFGLCDRVGSRNGGSLAGVPMDTESAQVAPRHRQGFKFAMNVYSPFASAYLTRNADNLLRWTAVWRSGPWML